MYYQGKNRLYAYADGNVYTLLEAYNMRLLSYEDICKIAYIYKNVEK